MDNIAIISGDNDIADKIASQVVLLRNNDSITKYTTENWKLELQENTPQLIIVQLKDNQSISIIEEIRFIEKFKETPIIGLFYGIDQEILCAAYDAGISDYICESSTNAEILVKVMWGLKRQHFIERKNSDKQILAELGVIDRTSGFYTKQFYEQVLKIELSNIKTQSKQSVLMLVTPDIKCKNILTQQFLASILKKILRNDDIVAFVPDNKFMIIVKEAQLNDSEKIFEKITNNLANSYSISASAVNVTEKTTLYELEKAANKALSEAIVKGKTLIKVNEINSKQNYGWADTNNLKENNFKIFKQIFFKKFSKIATPVFFQMQTVLSNKLFETTIKQQVGETESFFSLENDSAKSLLKITYPGFAKINIVVTNSGKNGESQDRTCFEITELTQSKLEDLLNTMVKTYKENTQES